MIKLFCFPSEQHAAGQDVPVLRPDHDDYSGRLRSAIQERPGNIGLHCIDRK